MHVGSGVHPTSYKVYTGASDYQDNEFMYPHYIPTSSNIIMEPYLIKELRGLSTWAN
jgi:hypothetical protein